MMMRERLARAMYADTSGHIDPMAWEQTDDETRDIYRSNVDAILREMMEPTDAMKNAGHEAAADGFWPVEVWQAMLQHILDEGRGDKENAA